MKTKTDTTKRTNRKDGSTSQPTKEKTMDTATKTETSGTALSTALAVSDPPEQKVNDTEMAAPSNMRDFISAERDRLTTMRETLYVREKEVADEIAGVNREMMAITAYENALTGKAVLALPGSRGSKNTSSTGTRSRKGSKRDSLVKLLDENPTGLARRDILERLGLKGDKAGEMSVSNALTALTKGNHVRRDGGKYFPVQAAA